MKEDQSEVEAVAEDEAAFEDESQTVLEVRNELVPAVKMQAKPYLTPPWHTINRSL